MFSKNIKVNFYNADPAGIMFFSNIFNFAHSAYEAMLESSNIERDYFNDEEYVIPIIHSEADYIKPIFPGDDITAETIVSVIRESSFELTYSFKNKTDEVLAVVKTVHVFVSKSTWDKTEIPVDFNRILLQHLEQKS